MPIFRGRQQEIIVLKDYDFGNKIFPLIEIVKEKDRKNNVKDSIEIYKEIINSISAEKVFIDLPVYLTLNNSTNDEVVTFSRSVIEDVDKRIDFLKAFAGNKKVIPVISSLFLKTGVVEIQNQFDRLKKDFTSIAFRTYNNTFEEDFDSINSCFRDNDYFIYDLDTIAITNPLFRRHKNKFGNNGTNIKNKILVRSAINTDIQNVKLDHGNIIAEADNTLLEMYSTNGFEAFGDYVGVKKDDMSSGGTISPGFIIFDPYENMYYGYKGERKSLDEFEDTIVPAVLKSPMIQNLVNNYNDYIADNQGYITLNNINQGTESGKNQAKFKKISMLHYLHCIKTSINKNDTLPLVIN